MSLLLQEILTHKRAEVEERKRQRPLSMLKEEGKERHDFRSLRQCLLPVDSTERDTAIIAEIKMGSPSKGVISERGDPVGIAMDYEKGGARAVSVLTEQRYFHGRLEYISGVKKRVKLPILRKDFILDPYQVYESWAKGADAVLLISGILEGNIMVELFQLGRELNMDVLLEVHDEGDIDRASPLIEDDTIVGINNRDLETLEVDTGNTLSLLGHLRSCRWVVSESGIDTREDILRLKEKGVNSFLVGESLMRCQDKVKKLKTLISGPS